MTFPPVMMLRKKRVHFIWSSAFTTMFCLVCGVPAASVVSSYDEAFCVYSFEFPCNWWSWVEVKRSFQLKSNTYFLRFCSRCRGTKLPKKSASSLKILPEPVPETRKLMLRGTAFFALRSCRVRVCSWTQLPPYLCRWFWKIGVCRRTSGWHALLLKHLLPATGQIMGFTLETGIFCFVPDGEISVGYCFDCCCFIFCTSPPRYEPGDDKSKEAADRRRGLLKKACSQERAVNVVNPNYPWSDSTSLRKPIC